MNWRRAEQCVAEGAGVRTPTKYAHNWVDERDIAVSETKTDSIIIEPNDLNNINGLNHYIGMKAIVPGHIEVRDAPFGIYLSESADCRITGNLIHGGGNTTRPPGNAIHLWSSRRVTVADNIVTGQRDGLYFEFVQEATIERNTSERNLRYGLHFMFSHHCEYRDNRFVQNGAGVAVMYTRDVAMERNAFDDNRGSAAYGLPLKDISESRITGNRFDRNTVGLLIEGGGRLAVSHNRFAGNGWAVKLMANSFQNRFEGNVFEGNSFGLAANSRITEAIVAGNWWDRYSGYDLDGNGRGDLAFRRSASSRCSWRAIRHR